MLIHFYLYRNSDGIITGTGTGSAVPVFKSDYDNQEDYDAAVAKSKADFLSAGVKEGFTKVEGHADLATQKVDTETGELVSYSMPMFRDFERVNRRSRNRLLAACDWTQVPDNPLSAAKKAEWATYRQSLRDLPDDVDTFTTALLDENTLPTEPS